jgi:hypothetical protein
VISFSRHRRRRRRKNHVEKTIKIFTYYHSSSFTCLLRGPSRHYHHQPNPPFPPPTTAQHRALCTTKSERPGAVVTAAACRRHHHNHNHQTTTTTTPTRARHWPRCTAIDISPPAHPHAAQKGAEGWWGVEDKEEEEASEGVGLHLLRRSPRRPHGQQQGVRRPVAAVLVRVRVVGGDAEEEEADAAIPTLSLLHHRQQRQRLCSRHAWGKRRSPA